MSEKSDAVARMLRDQFQPGDRVVDVLHGVAFTIVERWHPATINPTLEAYVVRHASGVNYVYPAARLRRVA